MTRCLKGTSSGAPRRAPHPPPPRARRAARIAEGAGVGRPASRLNAALTGRVLLSSDLRWPSLATVDLSGRTVTAVVSRGKHLLMRMDGAPAGTPPRPLGMGG